MFTSVLERLRYDNDGDNCLIAFEHYDPCDAFRC